jgi:hypothetical protein
MSAIGSSSMTYASALDNETVASSESTNETLAGAIEKIPVLKQNPRKRLCVASLGLLVSVSPELPGSGTPP